MSTIFVMGVCLSVCPEHSSVGFDPILIKLGCEVCIMIELCFPENGCAAPIMGGATPKKHVFLGGSRFQVTSSPRGFVESGRGFGIWLDQWHLHSPTGIDFSFSSQSQGHKVTNLENVKKINKLGIELLGFSTVSNESCYASSAPRVLQLFFFTSQ